MGNEMTVSKHRDRDGLRLRVAVLGAGPIGLEAALYGAALGHEVVVLERGEIGAAVRAWGHVAMFSPWAMNTSALGRRRLGRAAQAEAGDVAGSSAAGYGSTTRCPTGAEYVAQYLLPLSQDPLLTGRLRLHTRVVAVGRTGLRKGELIGKAERTQFPFRLLVEDSRGERVEHADVIFDCTGTYGVPNAVGDGGIAAPGERELGPRFFRHLPDILGADRSRFAGRRVLLVGGGLSAATAAVELMALSAADPSTRIVWSVRRDLAQPYQPIENDALPGRARLHQRANRIAAEATTGATPLRYWPATSVDGITAAGAELRVRLRHQDGSVAEESFDELLALTGYGPDRDLYRELQIHECYASFGPMRLAATLLGASGDCLAQPQPGPETLKNPEPRCFILGAKSYGRSSAFLLQLGLTQLRGAYALLHDDPTLDLYAEPTPASAT